MLRVTSKLFDFLLTRAASEAMAGLAQSDLNDKATLSLLTRLRRRFSLEEAGVLLDQARLRERAREKFPRAQELFFMEDALEQASGCGVATYRAARFSSFGSVADLGCGIGGDALGLAGVVPVVTAVERDFVRARMARANVSALVPDRRVLVVCADWRTLPLNVEAAFADPSRRIAGRRVFRLDQMDPPIRAILDLRPQIPNLAVKVAPGIKDEEIPVGAEVEFISERGVCKEALLLFEDFRQGSARSATLLPGPHRMASFGPVPRPVISPPRAFLYEPDPAILRARLVRPLASQLNASQIDPTIAYLTSDDRVETPFARSWQILRHGAFNLKRLSRWLADLHARDVVVKKRGAPIDPEAFRRRLKTCSEGVAVAVFITRSAGHPWMMVGEET